MYGVKSLHRFLCSVAAALLFASPVYAQAAGNSVSLTLTTSLNADGSLSDSLAWATAPTAATNCTASGDWSGTKAGSGSAAGATHAAGIGKSYALVCNWPGDTQAVLTWTAPDKFTDGSTLTKCAASTDSGNCLAKYRVRHGTVTGAWPDIRDVNSPTALTATWTGLGAGPHFFVVTAVTGYGAESAVSNEAGKTLNASVQLTQSAGVKIPNPPTGVQ